MPKVNHRETSDASAHAARRLASLQVGAEYAGVHVNTLRRRIAEGAVTGYRFGPRLIRVDLDELDAMLRAIPAGRAS